MAERRAGAARREAWALAAAVCGVGAGAWWVQARAVAGWAEPAVGIYATCLLLGPAAVYATGRGAGASAGAAATAALAVPALWLVKELHRVSGVHPPLEALYYALNPVALGVYAAAAVPLAVVEIGLRRRREGAWRVGGWPAAVLGAFVALAAGAALLGHDSGGREIFYAYVAVYRLLFGGA